MELTDEDLEVLLRGYVQNVKLNADHYIERGYVSTIEYITDGANRAAEIVVEMNRREAEHEAARLAERTAAFDVSDRVEDIFAP